MIKQALIAISATALLSGCGNQEHEAAVRAIKIRMYDPDSLQIEYIKDISVCQQFLPAGMEYKLVQMSVNGKNRIGGYTGYKTVFYNPNKYRLVELESWMINTVNTDFLGPVDAEEHPSTYEMAMQTCETLIDGGQA